MKSFSLGRRFLNHSRPFISVLVAVIFAITPLAQAGAGGPTLPTGFAGAPQSPELQKLLDSAIAAKKNGETILPITEKTIQFNDPELGPVKVVFDYAEAHSPEEAQVGKEWLRQETIKEDRDGLSTNLISITNAEASGPDAVTPANAELPADTHVVKTEVKMSLWQRLRQSIKEKFDAKLKVLAATEHEIKTPFLYRLLKRNDPSVKPTMVVRDYVRTFANARFYVVAGSVAAGMGMSFYFADRLDAQAVLATLLAVSGFSYLSKSLQLLGDRYMSWVTKEGFTARALRVVTEKVTSVAQHRTPEQVVVFNERFKKSALHKTVNTFVRFYGTEMGFLNLLVVLCGAVGVAYFPIVDVAQNSFNFASSMMLPLLHVFAPFNSDYPLHVEALLAVAAFKAYLSQGLLDTGNSNVRAGAIEEADLRLLEGEVTADEHDRIRSRIEFAASTRMLIVSALSNFAVVIGSAGSEHAPLLTLLGNAMIYGMAGAGGIYYVYSLVRFDHRFQDWLRAKSPDLALRLLGPKYAGTIEGFASGDGLLEQRDAERVQELKPTGSDCVDFLK